MSNKEMVSLNIAVENDELVSSITTGMSVEQIRKFILDIDVRMADVSFSEDIILNLIRSLRGDLTNEEKGEFVDKVVASLK